MSEFCVVGIDPGLTGAIAYLSGDFLELTDMPTIPDPKGRGNIICAHSVARIIDEYKPNLVVIEKQYAMKGQGVSSTFKTGFGYGVLLGICATLRRRTEVVTAPTWKKQFGLTGKEKMPHVASVCAGFRIMLQTFNAKKIMAVLMRR